MGRHHDETGSDKGMKLFNRTRYASLSMANPTPNAMCESPGGDGNDSDPDSEAGLFWDIASQVGAALKNNAPSPPLAGFKVEALYMTSQDLGMLYYMNWFHERAKLGNGKPIYDAYLRKSRLHL